MIKRVHEKLHLELFLGIILFMVLTGAYVLESTARYTAAKQADASAPAVYFRENESDWTISNPYEYYSSLSYIGWPRFHEQQSGTVCDILCYACWDNKQPSAVCTPVNIQVTGMRVLDALEQDDSSALKSYMRAASATKISDWNILLSRRMLAPEIASLEQLEMISQYIILDIIITPQSGNSILLGNNELSIGLAHEDGTVSSKNFLQGEGYCSSGKFILLQADRTIGLVDYDSQLRERIRYVEPGQPGVYENVVPKYSIDSQTHLKLLYVVTNEELESGRLAVFSDRHADMRSGQFYSNAGYIIYLQGEDRE